MDGYGEFIKKHRLASGYKSRRQLAEKSGISAATISRIEREIQKPETRTLKNLAPYLESTSYVELMVVCGYWDEEELLEPINGKELVGEYNKVHEEKKSVSEKTPSKNEKEFIDGLELSDEKLLEQFNLKLDGKKLSEDEARGIIAYLRSLRSIEK